MTIDTSSTAKAGDDPVVVSGTGRIVCVTGAGGFIASWLVKLLLEKGYTVKGTVRNPDDPKNEHLKEMKGAAQRLILYSADLLDYEALRKAIEGCEGVFHTASPVNDDPEQVVEPAIQGTKNVINAAADAGTVRRVVFTSSFGALTMDPSRGPDVVVDESCWSDLEFCKRSNNWYCYSKFAAEQAAWKVAGERGIELAVVVPAFVVGPLLQPKVNTSTMLIVQQLSRKAKTYANAVQGYVDVRDVADAHIRVYEAAETAGERFICVERVIHREDFFKIIERLFPEYPAPTECSDKVNPKKVPYKFSNKKLKDLGLQYTPIERSLYDTVMSLKDMGYLSVKGNSHI